MDSPAPAALRDLLAAGPIHRPASPADPDAIAADYVRRHAGVPATGRGGPEPVVVYPGNVLVGAYGDAGRVRGWLPGLPPRATPAAAAALLAGARAPERCPAPPCQEVVEDGAALGGLPLGVATPRDAGPFVTAGVIFARDPETGETALSAHRMLRTGPDTLTVWMVPGRQLRDLHARAVAAGRDLPVSVGIGVPPAVMIAAALGSRFLPAGTAKLAVAGALAQAPVRMAAGVSGPAPVPADAEIVLEGRLGAATAPECLPGRALGGSLPEFLGYDGRAHDAVPVLTVAAVTRRRDAYLQTVVGPGREQSVILGLAGALSVALSAAGPHWDVVADLAFPPAGGGMLLLVVAVRKRRAADDGAARLVARDVLAAHPFVKTVVAVDDDVDPHSAEDVLWAATTRANLGVDCHTWGGFTPLGMDPSQGAAWARERGADGGAGRTFVDATVPFALRGEAARSYAD
ncbi:3,4-dihydroxybenzoate decarboxylase [Spirilliplanes yamanashiensis]|uniref:3,4-dihydroxybenzoate decarboxylase n=1 Tax=Spirilliplanes yamanashiensis TaxID=42233 RepID=A0A8J3Y500_9ACTN|nr:3,4-dihydroxybenzoate decarboxylase [Spirilliplanes yamanashiensis]